MEQKEAETKKKTYAKPEVTEFGDIGNLTQGASSSAGDGVHINRK